MVQVFRQLAKMNDDEAQSLLNVTSKVVAINASTGEQFAPCSRPWGDPVAGQRTRTNFPLQPLEVECTSTGEDTEEICEINANISTSRNLSAYACISSMGCTRSPTNERAEKRTRDYACLLSDRRWPGCPDVRRSRADTGMGHPAPAVTRRTCTLPESCRRRRVRLCPEARIHKLLGRLPPAVRRAVISNHFTEEQRQSLEQWILSGQAKALMSVLASKPVTDKPNRICRNPANSSRLIPARLGKVQSPRGHVLYKPSICIGPIRLRTRSTARPDLAWEYFQVLARIRSRTREAIDTENMNCNVFSSIFERVVLEEWQRVQEKQTFDRRFKLHFSAAVHVKSWVGRSLETPARVVPGAVAAGLYDWRRLHEARCELSKASNADDHELEASLWRKLRSIYRDVWVQNGHSPEKIDLKLDKWEIMHKARLKRIVRPKLGLRSTRIFGGAGIQWCDSCNHADFRTVAQSACKANFKRRPLGAIRRNGGKLHGYREGASAKFDFSSVSTRRQQAFVEGTTSRLLDILSIWRK